MGRVGRLDEARPRAASRIRMASVRFIAMRASHRTCLPMSNALTVMRSCMFGQVPITTASMWLTETRARQSS